MPTNPQRAAELLKLVYPEGEPDEDLGDLGERTSADEPDVEL